MKAYSVTAMSLLLSFWMIQPAMGSDWAKWHIPESEATEAPEIRDDYALEIDRERVRLTRKYFKIHNRSFYKKMPRSNKPATISFDPQMVVVHFTAIPTLEEMVAYIEPNRIASDRGSVTKNGALNVGIQFIVDQDGVIYRSYPENAISRHVIGLNHAAIGIENVGNADLGAEAKDGVVPLTEAQLEANIRLIKYLAGKYKNLKFLIGHMEYRDVEDPDHPAHALFQEDIPSYRTDKVDPGPNFMADLRARLREGE